MAELVHELLFHTAARHSERSAIIHDRHGSLSYGQLAASVRAFADGLDGLGVERHERVGVYLPKRPETVVAMLGGSAAGAVFVPINPLLKARQVGHILQDCNVGVLVTARERLEMLGDEFHACHDLRTVIVVDDAPLPQLPGPRPQVLGWDEFLRGGRASVMRRCIDTDMAAILYTSGSTGRPKGVVLSHRNLVTGARSVAQYLGIVPEDRILAVLPFSFDYGLNQLTTAWLTAATVVLMDYLLPRDVIRACAQHRITGLAAVPPLWIQLAQLPWPPEAAESLRYLTNSGGAMPRAVTQALRQALPKTRVFLMYGLTEAFRSTYLPPEELDRHPESIGKAIPSAEILVVREDGSPCAPGEPGELVHRGALVAMGYWNDPDRTAERFRPAPGRPAGIPLPEIAVWSGDTVKADEEGFLYFIGRRDEMIKTSGYRVSPTEIEEVLYATGQIAEAAAVGIPHPVLGQAVVAVVRPAQAEFSADALIAACKRDLPNFMVPAQVLTMDTLPRNPNGKIDRRRLAVEYADLFKEQN